MDVFVDEAGDLGFRAGATKTFVVAYLIPQSSDRTRVNIQRARRKIRKSHGPVASEFKFSRDSDRTKKFVLEALSRCVFDLGYVVIDKSFVKAELRRPDLLYNYLVVNYIITNMVNAYDLKSIRFTIDKSLSKEARQQFDRYLGNKVSWRQVVENEGDMPAVQIDHKNSYDDPCLQAADYCAGAAFRYFEHGDAAYYSLLKSRMKFSNAWGEIKW